MKKVTLILATVALMISTNLFAQELKDIAGAKDNPLISRFQGSVIQYYRAVKWDKYVLPYSEFIGGNQPWPWKNILKLQGEINRIQYVTSKDNNAAYVYMNYLDALKKSDWEILYSGSGDDELGNKSYEWQFFMFQEGLNLRDKFGSKYGFRGGSYAYIAAKYEDNDTSYYAAIYIIEQDDETMINQDIIKVKNPDVGLVTAKLLTEKIDKKGHLALDGIFFETGKDVITDKSQLALKNITDFLNSHKDKKFFIVGHTDNVGDFASNMTLSENRAKAVMNELVSKYEVNANQLKAHGVSSLSPVSSNSSDEGRAKNRRVEIVEQ